VSTFIKNPKFSGIQIVIILTMNFAFSIYIVAAKAQK